MFKFLALSLSLAILVLNGTAQEKVNVKFGKISLYSLFTSRFSFLSHLIINSFYKPLSSIMRFLFLVGTCLLVFSSLHSFGQSNRVKVKLGDVKPEDFAPAAYAIDSSAEAVYLYDAGKVKYEPNNNGYLDVVYRCHERIRLMNKNAFSLATVEIPLQVESGYEEKFISFSASTYNIEDGKVVETKVGRSSIFRDKQGDFVINKFTFPNLKEGSIIEYSYTIDYPGYYYLPNWTFQSGYPCLWSEYEVAVPEFYDYVVLKQGYHPFAIDTASIAHDTYHIRDASDAFNSTVSFSQPARTVTSLWAMKDIPALKPESFTTTLANHVAKIEFQLSAVKYPNQPVKPKMRNWPDVADELMKSEIFGEALTHGNNWLNDDIKKATADATAPLDKAKKIYEFVRDNYTCTDYSARYLSQSLKKVMQTRKGNVTDINMLLTAMLKNAGFNVNPVLLSTRDHGKTFDMYPVLSKFNYTITQLTIDDKSYLLDASVPKLGFNHLSEDCYNGSARIINASWPGIINLSADSLRESTVTSVFIVNGENHKIEGSYSSRLGYMESKDLRNDVTTANQEEYFKRLKKSFSYDVDMKNTSIDSLNKYDDPVQVKYEFSFNFNEDDELVYFDPFFNEKIKENPFKAAERNYPVERPYCVNQTYVLNMDIPEGYVVDELPKSARVKLNEDEGMFEYMIGLAGNHIQLRSILNIKKANFLPEDYQTLRDFFSYVVKKQAEQVVFKKAK